MTLKFWSGCPDKPKSTIYLSDVYFRGKRLAVVLIVYRHQGGDEGENHEEDHHDGVGDLEMLNV